MTDTEPRLDRGTGSVHRGRRRYPDRLVMDTRTLQPVIYLRRGQDAWYAVHSDPRVYQLFGSASIPTPYLPATPAGKILADIRRLNPDALVRLAHGSEL